MAALFYCIIILASINLMRWFRYGATSTTIGCVVIHLFNFVYRTYSRPIAVFARLFVTCFAIAGMPFSAIAGTDSCKQYSHLTFGILPFVSNEQLVIQFSPLVQYLSEKLAVPVRIETAPDFAEFAKRTADGSHYDILFTAPHFYPVANSMAGYRLIASVDSPGMWAVIVAPKASAIYTLQDLKGKRLATVDPAGLATLLVKKHLLNAGIDPEADLTLVTTPSHDASLLSSYHGVTDASSLMQPPYTAASEQVRRNMRIIARTESAPHIPISISPKISDECAAEVAGLLLDMRHSEEGREALSHNRFSGFRKAYPEDYERIRDLLTPTQQ